MSGTEGLLIVGAHARLGYVHYLRGNYDAAVRRVPARAGIRHDERPRATRTNAHRAAPEVQRAVIARAATQEAAKRFGDMAIEAHTRRVANGADDPATRYYMAALYAGRGDVERTREHLKLPLRRLPEFTRWRLQHDRDFDAVRAQLEV